MMEASATYEAYAISGAGQPRGTPAHSSCLVRQDGPVASESDGGQRDECRNEEHEPALVADVMKDQFECSESQPQPKQSLTGGRDAPAREHARGRPLFQARA